MSVTMISVREIIPPPPMPWIDRPTRIMVKFFATAETMAPTVKKMSATRIRLRRPKMSEREAKFGWKTVEVIRKEVPDQKASIAVP